MRATSRTGARNLAPAAAMELAATISDVNRQPAVYIFNKKEGGTCFISASDAALPLLGYTDEGSFSMDSAPAPLMAWLEDYASQIAFAEEKGLAFKEMNQSTTQTREFIAPMIKTKWNQMAPYNQDLSYRNYATGCVATAMAQIMNYWQYPAVGHGSITYTFMNPFWEDETVSMDFSEAYFDWDNMLDTYVDGRYSAQQADAVALLMKACGYSVQTVYGGSSGAKTEYVAVALPQYFGYDGSVESLKRMDFSASEWSDILYDQLKNVGPVLYTGNSIYNLAHAFVADGYDGAGYFHINWGWSGLSDGYFALDALNPPVQSTGGSSYGGYNYFQGMIINIKKAEGMPPYTPGAALTLLGNVSGSLRGNELTLSLSQANPGNIINNSPVDINPVFGISLENQATGSKAYSEVAAILIDGKEGSIPEVPAGSYTFNELGVIADLNPDLPDGKYKVSFIWKEDRPNAAWQNFISSDASHDYCYLEKDGGALVIENLPINKFNIDKAELLTPLFNRNPCEIRFTLTNPTEFELTQSVIPLLYYVEDDTRTLSFEGTSQLVTVPANSTIEATLVCKFTGVSGGVTPTNSRSKDYIMGAYDYCAILDQYYSMGIFGESYYGDLCTVTMTAPANGAGFTDGVIAVDSAVEESTEGKVPVYGINDFSHIVLSVSATCVNGFLASPLYAQITEYNPADGSLSQPVFELTFPNLFYAYPDEKAMATAVINMPDYDVDAIYDVAITYMVQSEMKTLGHARFAASSSVDKVEDFNSSQIIAARIYDINGRMLVNLDNLQGYSMSELLQGMDRGVYAVKVFDSSGNSMTLKIAK